MPTLCVLRHAKSERTLPIDDHEQPLGRRGLREAPLIGDWLRVQGLEPSLVLCSSAKRAQDTLTALGDLGAAEVDISGDLYLASGRECLARLRAVPGERSPVLLLGHNPGLHDLAMALAGDSGGAALRSGLATGAVAVLEFPGAWADLAPGAAHLAAFVRPRDLPRGAPPA